MKLTCRFFCFCLPHQSPDGALLEPFRFSGFFRALLVKSWIMVSSLLSHSRFLFTSASHPNTPALFARAMVKAMKAMKATKDLSNFELRIIN